MTTDLLKRLEAGETGMEIEVAIFYALSSVRVPANVATDSVDAQWNWLSYFHSGWTGITTSLDAAVALVERVRPGVKRHLLWDDEGADARLDWGSDFADSAAPTPAAALIAALLKAEGAEDE